MRDRRRGLTADERLADVRRAHTRLRRERMLRELAGPIWHRMVKVIPVIFPAQGTIAARVLRADRSAVIEALRSDAIFGVDTAMRLAHGCGFLASGDIQAYVASVEPLDRLAREGLIDAVPFPDTTLVRPWPGPPRLLACIVEALPPSRATSDGHRVVCSDRLRRELIGTVGARADLFTLLERVESAGEHDADVRSKIAVVGEALT
jgi:hypothetical protein